MTLKVKILKKIDYWKRWKIRLYEKAYDEGYKFGRHERDHELLVAQINRRAHC
jgi:hypothetical protein